MRTKAAGVDKAHAATVRHWLSEHGTKPKVKAAIERAIEKLEES
jgi:hypothetical protein